MRLTLLLPTAAAVLIAVAGCGAVTGSPSAGGSGGSAPPPAAATATADDQPDAPDVDNVVEACDLLSDEDVEPFVGDVEGQENPVGGDGGSCTWTNPTTYNSVSLEIGLSGTAPGDELPAWDDSIGPEKPLSDGLRATAGGQVEFVVDTRDCFLQVATTNGGDADEQAAARLAVKVRDQL
jgi:hypothetical protein